MAEYIEREAALREIERREARMVGDKRVSVDAMKSFIKNRPAADVAPVVRCKDCKHYDMGVCLKIYSDGSVHPAAWQSRKPEDFCSYGDRMAGADNG